MTWKPDSRTLKSYGPLTVVSETRAGLTAHLVTFEDGTQLRVLPDTAHSGNLRARVVRDACEEAGHLSERHGHLRRDVVRGRVAAADLEWEEVSDAPTFDEWLAEWFDPASVEARLRSAPEFLFDRGSAARRLLKDMDAGGWVVQKGET